MAVVLISWAISQIVWGKESFLALILQVVLEGIWAIIRVIVVLYLYVILFIVSLFKPPDNGKT